MVGMDGEPEALILTTASQEVLPSWHPNNMVNEGGFRGRNHATHKIFIVSCKGDPKLIAMACRLYELDSLPQRSLKKKLFHALLNGLRLTILAFEMFWYQSRPFPSASTEF